MKFRVGDRITNGSQAGLVTEVLAWEPRWRCSGARITNIPIAEFGGNVGWSQFIPDYLSWEIASEEWTPRPGGDLEQRWTWDGKMLVRELRERTDTMGLEKATSTPSLPENVTPEMLAPHDHTDPGRDGIPMDHYDRYLLPDPAWVEHPDGLAPARPWTRSSTLKGRTQSKDALQKYDTRMVLKGLAISPDLIAMAAATPLNERGAFGVLADVAEQARIRAGGRASANLGTAMHSFTEAYDRGEPLEDVLERMPEALRPDLQAYVAELERLGLRPVPEYIERVVVNAKLRTGDTWDGKPGTRKDSAAGTAARFDRMYLWTDPADGVDYLIGGDLKTGKNAVEYGSQETCCQIATAVNADAMWNEDTGQYDPMPVRYGVPFDTATTDPDAPTLRTDIGVLIHLPVGQGFCHVEELDLVFGWWLAELGAKLLQADRAKSTCHRPLELRLAMASEIAERVEQADAYARETISPAFADALKAPASAELPGYGTAPVPAVPTAQDKAADGSPLQPLAADGQRGCSACRRIGHRKGSPKCWANQDPAGAPGSRQFAESQYQADMAELDRVAAEQRAHHGVDQQTEPVPASVIACGPDGAVTELPPEDVETVKAFAGHLEKMGQAKAEKDCPHSGGFTRQADVLGDLWVCADCGQETPQAEKARQAREAMDAGRGTLGQEAILQGPAAVEELYDSSAAHDAAQEGYDQEQRKRDRAADIAAAEVIAQDQAAARAQETDGKDEPDLFQLIEMCTSQAQLSQLRKKALAESLGWTKEHTAAGLQKLKTLDN